MNETIKVSVLFSSVLTTYSIAYEDVYFFRNLFIFSDVQKKHDLYRKLKMTGNMNGPIGHDRTPNVAKTNNNPQAQPKFTMGHLTQHELSARRWC